MMNAIEIEMIATGAVTTAPETTGMMKSAIVTVTEDETGMASVVDDMTMKQVTMTT